MSRWHPSAEEIDDAIDADLAQTTRGRVLARHLEQCDECAGIRSSLLDTRAQLKALGQTPPPLPPDWDQRLAEALRRAREHPLDAPARERRRRPWFALAASAALLLAVGAGFGPRLIDSIAPSQSTATGIAADAQRSSTVAPAQPATPGGREGAAAAQDMSAGEAQPSSAAGGLGAGIGISSGTDYRPATVGRQMRAQLLAVQQAGWTSSADDSQLAGLTERCTGLMRLGVASRPETTTVRLLDQARWQGEPAVIVVADAASGHGMDVWVMPAKCQGARPVAKVADVAAS